MSGNTEVEEEVPEDDAALLITGDVTPADDRPGTDGDAVPVRGIHRRARPRTSTDQQQQQGRHGDLPPGGLAVAGSLSIARQHGEALTWSKSRRCGRAGSPALTATIPRIRHPDASKNQITHAYHRRATRRIDSLLIIGLLEHIRGAMRVTALRMERQDFRACEPRNTGSW
jgi:hypothetical protein